MRKHESNIERYQKKDDAKLPYEQARLEVCIESFDDLNTELKSDIPALMNDTDLFLASIYGQFISIRTSFHSMILEYHKDFLNTIHVSEHPSRAVIIPRDQSSVSRAYTVGTASANVSHSNSYTTGTTSANVSHGSSFQQPPQSSQPNQSAAQPLYSQPASQPQYAAQPPLPPRTGGLRAKAMWDYNAQNPSELSMRAGDMLNILQNNSDWWQAELNGRTGFVPGNYVQVVA
eukprot:TRINITY_DN1456_c0_g1_i2.p1 TRINITY_DN1456_c0_g1~~TRINITY_DN1456_c0_g1_i2.p1  ORF type:complete len:232 (+),score=33.20 TRINITY_DN1456_c0_g1_i2:244-939(+)